MRAKSFQQTASSTQEWIVLRLRDVLRQEIYHSSANMRCHDNVACEKKLGYLSVTDNIGYCENSCLADKPLAWKFNVIIAVAYRQQSLSPYVAQRCCRVCGPSSLRDLLALRIPTHIISQFKYIFAYVPSPTAPKQYHNYMIYVSDSCACPLQKYETKSDLDLSPYKNCFSVVTVDAPYMHEGFSRRLW